MSVEIVSAILAGPDAEPAHRKIMGQIATLISAKPTKRFIHLLTNWSFGIRSAECIEKITPSRTKVLNELKQIERHALKLREMLQFSQAATYLTDVPEVFRDIELHLATSAHRTRHSPTFVSANGKIRRGAGKAFAPEQALSKPMCAAIVAEIWAFYHGGKYPAPTNVSACRAAHLLFHSHQATRKGSWGVPENGWKRHFKRIDDQNLISLRTEVRRLLPFVKI